MKTRSFEDSTTTAGVTYYGETFDLTASDSDPVFTITAYTTATKKWSYPDGTAARNKKWSLRASYSYT